MRTVVPGGMLQVTDVLIPTLDPLLMTVFWADRSRLIECITIETLREKTRARRKRSPAREKKMKKEKIFSKSQEKTPVPVIRTTRAVPHRVSCTVRAPRPCQEFPRQSVKV